MGVELQRYDNLCACDHLASKHERRFGKCTGMVGLTPCPCKRLEALYRTDDVKRRYNYAKVLEAEYDYLHVCGWTCTRAGDKALWTHQQRGVNTLMPQQTAMKLQRGWDGLLD